MTEEKRLVFPENGSRNAEYAAKLKKIGEAGTCPFCPEHLKEFVGEKQILRRWKHWTVTKTDPPYKGSVAHMLVISRHHVTRSTELSSGARIEYFSIIDWIVREYAPKHYTVLMRSGDPESGATVAHLHFHVASAGEEIILTRIG